MAILTTAQLQQPGIRKGRQPLTRGLGYPQIPILYKNETLHSTTVAMQSGRGAPLAVSLAA